MAAAVTALCYAEMAAMIPAAGSTYSYAYATFGMFLAWFIGWDLLLEYLFAASTVAVGWAGYFDALLQSIGITLPHSLTNAPFQDDPGVVNLPAISIVLLTCCMLYRGTRESTRANNAMVALKLVALLLVRRVGVWYVDGELAPVRAVEHGRVRRLRHHGRAARGGRRVLRLRGLRRRLDGGGRGAPPAADDPDRADGDGRDLDAAVRPHRGRDDRDGRLPRGSTSPTRSRRRCARSARRSTGWRPRSRSPR